MPEFHFRHGRIHLGRRSSSASGFPGLTVSLRGAGVKSLAFPSVLAPQMRKPSALITRPPCPPVPCSCPGTSHRRGISSGRERPKASAWGNPPRLSSREVLPPPDPDPGLTPGEGRGMPRFPGKSGMAADPPLGRRPPSALNSCPLLSMGPSPGALSVHPAHP